MQIYNNNFYIAKSETKKIKSWMKNFQPELDFANKYLIAACFEDLRYFTNVE
jgi:hypothetical protein